MKNTIRTTLTALAAAVSLAPAFPAHAGLVMTISDNNGNTVPVTITQPGGPGTDFVGSYAGSLGPLSLMVTIGDSNSPTLTDPARLDTTVVVSGGTPTTTDIVTITVTDNGVTFPAGSTMTLTSSAVSNPSGNASMTFQGSAAGTATPLQTIPAGSTNGSVVSTPITGATTPYTMSATTTLTFAAGVVASANVDNIVQVTAPEPGSMIIWTLVACSVCVPAVRRRWRSGDIAVHKLG